MAHGSYLAKPSLCFAYSACALHLQNSYTAILRNLSGAFYMACRAAISKFRVARIRVLLHNVHLILNTYPQRKGEESIKSILRMYPNLFITLHVYSALPYSN